MCAMIDYVVIFNTLIKRLQTKESEFTKDLFGPEKKF